jgi:hypothetical protein
MRFATQVKLYCIEYDKNIVCNKLIINVLPPHFKFYFLLNKFSIYLRSHCRLGFARGFAVCNGLSPPPVK